MTVSDRPLITGYGAVGSWGSGIEELWRVLAAARPAGRRWVPDDGDAEAFAAPLPDSYRPHPDIPRSLAAHLDRGSAIALDAALQALAMAGLGPGAGDARRFALVDALPLRAPGQPGIYVPYGHTIARALGIRGPVLTVGGGEAAGGVAVATAIRLVREGVADVVLVGGAQALQAPLLAHLRDLGAAGEPARPFDREHRGFVPAEGGAYLVLEEAAHASSRGVPGIATAAAAVTFDPTAEPLAFSDPTETGRAIQAVLAAAGVLQDQVDLVVSGADGRVARDFTEGYAIRRVFGRHAHYATLTAPAGTLGNALGASAVLHAVAALECVRRQEVPPIAAFERGEADFDLAYATALRSERLDTVLVTAFALGGTNAALLFDRAETGRP